MKKAFLILGFVCDAVLLYMAIGYTFRGITGAKLVGDATAHFVGYYMLAAPFWAIVLILTAILVFFLCKKKK